MESELAFHHEIFRKFHVPYACTSDACALGTRQRFVTERRKKKERKPKPKPRPDYLGKKALVSVFRPDFRRYLELGLQVRAPAEQRLVIEFIPL